MLEGAVSWEDASTFIYANFGNLPVVVNFARAVVGVDGSRDVKSHVHWSQVWSVPLQRVEKAPLVVVCCPRMVNA